MAKREKKAPAPRYARTRSGYYRNGLHIPRDGAVLIMDPEEKLGSRSWIMLPGRPAGERIYKLPRVGGPPPAATRRAMARTSVPSVPDTLSEAQEIENEEEAERLEAAGADPDESPRSARGSSSFSDVISADADDD